MTRIALVADRRTATSFKLAGLESVHRVENAAEAEKCIRDLLEKSDLTIILVTEGLVDQIHELIEEIGDRKYPLVVPIPSAEGAATMKRDLIIDLIKRKAGIEVKL
ncbi:MAG: hypothetical protein JSV58_00160 [Candidatus Bathyarchaeota archaeon]|nr:MAG: hypothetical protein JSV58_00160 [Candidatus Bathyarchaeota archaeon]